MRRGSAELILFIIALILGATFVIVKDVLTVLPPLYFLFFRFLIAIVALLPFLVRDRAPVSRHDLRAGVLLGLALAAGFSFQTIGLQTTLAAKAAFITGLNVVLVPPLAHIWFREYLPTRAILGVICATLGLALLCLDADMSLAMGDIWLILCAIAFAVQIAGVAHYSANADTMRFSVIQIAVTMVAVAPIAIAHEPFPRYVPLRTMGELLFMGVIATAAITYYQIVAQRGTTATRAAILFSLEPLFALGFAWVLLEESMNAQQLMGAGLMLAGVLISESRLPPLPNTCSAPWKRVISLRSIEKKIRN